MPRFFVRQERISNGCISIIGEDAHHIARSLRMAAGEEITVCDMQGNEYNCKISAFDDDKEVIAEILSQKKSENEPKVFITLYQALPKGDKLDTIIQKAVECGASKIVPFQSERCVVKIKNDAEDKKREILNNPLVVLIISSLEILTSNWSYESVFKYSHSLCVATAR